MGLWIVWNGWDGSAPIAALVEADDRDGAVTAASAALRADAEATENWGGGEPTYSASYWEPGRLIARRVSLPLVGGFDVEADAETD